MVNKKTNKKWIQSKVFYISPRGSNLFLANTLENKIKIVVYKIKKVRNGK